VTIISLVGNGKYTLFWTDSWQQSANLAPYLSALVNKRRAKRRTLHETLGQDLWVQDIQDALTVPPLVEYLELWDLVTKGGATTRCIRCS